jgi:DNA repair protein RadC
MGDRASDERGGRGNLAEAPPHYHGHRARLRQRFREAGAEALPDYELLEMVLYGAFSRGDTKPLAKELIRRFGSFAEVVAAPEARLAEVPGVGESVITMLKVVHAAAARLRRVELRDRPVLSSWSAVLDYCRAAMAFAEKEQFRIPLLSE